VNFERERREDAWGFFGVQDCDGVRLKSHHCQRSAFESGNITGNFYILLVSGVDAIEVANGQDTTIGQLTKLRYGFQDFHNYGLS
jgi:hypothetical protein